MVDAVAPTTILKAPQPQNAAVKAMNPQNILEDYQSFGMRGRYDHEITQDKLNRGEKIVSVNHDAIAQNKKKYDNMVQDVAEMDFQKWLQITVAGFRFQDPMNPKDPGAVTAELAQVGAAVATSKIPRTLDDMHATLTKNMSLTASQKLGQKVEVQNDTFHHEAGEETKLGFDLPVNASKIQISIFDENMSPVHNMLLSQGDTVKMNGEDKVINLEMGRNNVYWHGLKSNRVQADSGKYSFQIRAYDHNGKLIKNPDSPNPITIRKYVQGTLDGTFFDDQKGSRALVDGIEIAFDDIKRFYADPNDVFQKAPLPEYPQPHMTVADHPSFNDETNKKWAQHQANFISKELSSKTEAELANDMEKRLSALNLDAPRSENALKAIKDKLKAQGH